MWLAHAGTGRRGEGKWDRGYKYNDPQFPWAFILNARGQGNREVMSSLSRYTHNDTYCVRPSGIPCVFFILLHQEAMRGGNRLPSTSQERTRTLLSVCSVEVEGTSLQKAEDLRVPGVGGLRLVAGNVGTLKTSNAGNGFLSPSDDSASCALEAFGTRHGGLVSNDGDIPLEAWSALESGGAVDGDGFGGGLNIPRGEADAGAALETGCAVDDALRAAGEDDRGRCPLEVHGAAHEAAWGTDGGGKGCGAGGEEVEGEEGEEGEDESGLAEHG
ncbi:hypothetical protein CC1G_13999 [Coprinopsis cinerea okayama7|uniref:Uncharacterized protein n=1 Tax=Coprinopsis cinerea (strain Okayama-7 / 130 / ATCC MYA-4618 / FGSC 9003) TaxID=240176 RepID=D6RKS3_COPC7|nr:hypothetical protein CC1G_13999 [Coprinopsis cinerea okayama7\|eukprot:XP_002911960.1 hypothetical protein CC1G_13999 [Coprinopsis cinerea okayama7\